MSTSGQSEEKIKDINNKGCRNNKIISQGYHITIVNDVKIDPCYIYAPAKFQHIWNLTKGQRLRHKPKNEEGF